jgi:hypothetical protein
MSVERVYHCDGPDCERHARIAVPDRLPTSFLLVTRHEDPDQHFCSWDCVLRFAAAKEPTDVFPVGSPQD